MTLRQTLGALCVAASISAPAHAAIFATVVGIDDYAYQSDLDGAVNDARDLSAALRQRGADVQLLLDREATRSAIVRSIRSQMSKARRGDVVVFTFAGHGIQVPEALAGDERDGKDENFVFYAFERTGEGAGERLRDNDIAMLLREAPQGVSVLFVADSCHSGTMTRAPAPGTQLGKTRFLELGPIEDDPLPPPDRVTFQVEATDLAHVVFAAAARDNELTPEVVIDDQRRGALSWSVARAIERGLVDGTGDGPTTMAAFREFVRAQVRAHSGARQTPDVVFSEERADLDGLVSLLAGDAARVEDAAATGAQAAADLPLEPAAPPPLAVIGTPPSALLTGQARIVPEAEATLVWETATGRLIDRIAGDVVAEATTEDDVIAALNKWSTVHGLQQWAPLRAFDIRLRQGDGLHVLGTKLHIVINKPEVAPRTGYLTLFNLASQGEVQYVFPSETSVANGEDVVFRSETEMVMGPATVEEPVGADHLIAVISDKPPTDLRQVLRGLHGLRSAPAVLKLLAEHAGTPGAARIAVLPIMTARR